VSQIDGNVALLRRVAGRFQTMNSAPCRGDLKAATRDKAAPIYCDTKFEALTICDLNHALFW
jgi:hypothetical protein